MSQETLIFIFLPSYLEFFGRRVWVYLKFFVHSPVVEGQILLIIVWTKSYHKELWALSFIFISLTQLSSLVGDSYKKKSSCGTGTHYVIQSDMYSNIWETIFIIYLILLYILLSELFVCSFGVNFVIKKCNISCVLMS